MYILCRTFDANFSCASHSDVFRWIGLQYTGPWCGTACRDQWRWTDDSAPSGGTWHNWKEGEPIVTNFCAIIGPSGLWQGMFCPSQRKFTCKKGKICFVNLFVFFSCFCLQSINEYPQINVNLLSITNMVVRNRNIDDSAT